MSDTTLVILVFLVGGIGLLVGGAIGAILAAAFSGQDNGPAKGKPLTETLRVWRDKRSSRLALEVGGKLYEKPADMPEKTRQGLARLVQELAVWAGAAPLDAAASPAPAARPAAPAAPPPRSDRPPAPVTAAAAAMTADSLVDSLRAEVSGESAPTSPPPPAVTVKTPAPAAATTIKQPAAVPLPPVGAPEPVKADVGSLWRTAFTGSKGQKEAPPPLLSIAAQIDEVVQERLPASALRGRQIKVMDVPPHGLVVVVDGQQFEGVNDVTDSQVRQFLRECVAEWENRSA